MTGLGLKGRTEGGPSSLGMDIDVTGEVPGLEKFRTVQNVLDANKLLITQVTRNQEERSPEALEKNGVLIKELNNNLYRVVELYKDIADTMANSSQSVPVEVVEEISTDP